MIKKNSFKYEELIECANGKLFGPGNAKLPSPPMLMFNRITNIEICNKNKKLAKKVNFEILKNLFNIKKRYNYKFWLIQISTDQLYDAISFKTKSREGSEIKMNNYMKV